MQKCIVGRKLGMTQLFDENGKFIPVTVVELALVSSFRKRQSKTTVTKPCRSVLARSQANM